MRRDDFHNDARFSRMVDCVVYDVMGSFSRLPQDQVRDMYHVASQAAWLMLKMIYEQERELTALRNERDIYREHLLERYMKTSPVLTMKMNDLADDK